MQMLFSDANIVLSHHAWTYNLLEGKLSSFFLFYLFENALFLAHYFTV